LSLAPVKSRLVLPFWYRLTQVVLEKRPLNGCCKVCCIPSNVHALKIAGCGVAMVALKTTGCDVWKLECQASNVTASAKSDRLLYGYMLAVFF